MESRSELDRRPPAALLSQIASAIHRRLRRAVEVANAAISVQLAFARSTCPTGEENDMAKRTIDADAILNRAKPLAHQHAVEIQPFGHLVKLPIALSEVACKESVENLNQLLADT